MLLATSTDGKETARPTLIVHVSVEALSEAKGNGVTESGAVVDSEVVRMLSCDARIQVVLKDPAGHPLGMGSETRTPSRDLRRACCDAIATHAPFPVAG